jgi:hypothetical protein
MRSCAKAVRKTSSAVALQEVVYGEIEDYLVFLRKSDAVELSACRQALRSSKTWGEFRTRISADAYSELMEFMDDAVDFLEFCWEALESDPDLTLDEVRSEYLKLPIGERLAEDEDAFSQEHVPWTYDGDWPRWPAQEMLRWVPKEIQERYGTVEDSVLNGEFLTFDPSDERRIVAAFKRSGYLCVRDNRLVERASGYDV